MNPGAFKKKIRGLISYLRGNVKMRRLVLVSFLVLLLLGCASIAIQDRLKQIEKTMNPLVGRTKKDAVLTLGAPTDIKKIEDIEVYIWYFSYGTRATAVGNPYYPSAYGKAWEQYDLIRAYFDEKDKMIKWDSYVQR